MLKNTISHLLSLLAASLNVGIIIVIFIFYFFNSARSLAQHMHSETRHSNTKGHIKACI